MSKPAILDLILFLRTHAFFPLKRLCTLLRHFRVTVAKANVNCGPYCMRKGHGFRMSAFRSRGCRRSLVELAGRNMRYMCGTRLSHSLAKSREYGDASSSGPVRLLSSMPAGKVSVNNVLGSYSDAFCALEPSLLKGVPP